MTHLKFIPISSGHQPERKTVIFYSINVIDEHKSYTVTEKELLGIVETLK